ncbi:hypothetical protein QUF80_09680 [Desulfococcaceae bacterium HSG8]|nr:hypothetical protein [Desulfococcaceae bacterium HSG8]
MTYDVLLTKKDKKFVARVCQWPEIVAEGDTEDGTLDMVRSGLRNLLFGGRLVQLDIGPEADEHAWSEYAGMFADDPDWEEFQESIREYRREAEAGMIGE